MSEADLVMEGLNLMLLGMGIVFTFLVILIFALLGMSRLAELFIDPHETASQQPASAPAAAVGATDSADRDLIAVIGAAVARYRAGRH